MDDSGHQRDAPTLQEIMAGSPSGGTRSRNELITELFDRWSRCIRRLLRNRRSLPASDVDDLAQEVFLRLLRYSDETAIENPGGYLFRVAENVANEWSERARMRHPHDDSGLHELPCESKDEPEIALARAQRIQHIQAAVEELPARRREVLISHVEHGMTYKEIARQHGLTNRIVRRDISRAYGALRLQLKLDDL